MNDLTIIHDEIVKLRTAYKAALDSAELSWTVIYNVNGGDWDAQGKTWKDAAELARTTYCKALAVRPQSEKTNAAAAAPSKEGQ